VQEFR